MDIPGLHQTAPRFLKNGVAAAVAGTVACLVACALTIDGSLPNSLPFEGISLWGTALGRSAQIIAQIIVRQWWGYVGILHFGEVRNEELRVSNLVIGSDWMVAIFC